MKQLDRLMFLQGRQCFFCQQTIPDGEASVEHLVASANGGGNGDENCVACCNAVNLALGSLSIKEKIKVVLNQKGAFACPRTDKLVLTVDAAACKPQEDKISEIIDDLLRRGTSRPRKVATLQNTISAVFKKKLSDAEISALFAAMMNKGYIVVDEQKVSYALPQKAA